MGKRKSNLAVIILAAGKGLRMKSDIPKVLHKLGSQTLLERVIKSTKQAGATEQVVVLGYKGNLVSKFLPPEVKIVTQTKPLGTGHAVKFAKKILGKNQGEVIVLCGDTPLITPQTLKYLVKKHRSLRAKLSILTAEVAEPKGYGRVVRDSKNTNLISSIIEEKEATQLEKEIREINSGIYCFSLDKLWENLALIRNNNKKREYYLTDIVAIMQNKQQSVVAVKLKDATEIIGINARRDLSIAWKILNKRKLDLLKNSGVTIWDDKNTWIDQEVEVGKDTIIFPGTYLKGKTKIGKGSLIGPEANILDSKIGEKVEIKYSVIEKATIGLGTKIGPFAHLRPGTKIGKKAKIGNFAEINRSKIADEVKVGHFSYLGDAIVEEKVNIGAGTVTANYNGKCKQNTIIKAGAFIGSNTTLIAPTKVGKRALLGAGAVLVSGKEVPAGKIAVGVPAKVIKKRK